MIKIENMVKTIHGENGNVHIIRCEKCGAEYARRLVTSRTRPICGVCNRELEREKSKFAARKRLNKEYARGYTDGFKNAIKAGGDQP